MITGKDRNEDKAVVHYYDGTYAEPGKPLCRRGWNREDGFGYSIFRNTYDVDCKVCLRRKAKGLKGIEPKQRKTKWL